MNEKKLKEMNICCYLLKLLCKLNEESLKEARNFIKYLISKQENNE